MSFATNNFAEGTNFDFATVQPTYGPNFNTKCIFGFQRVKYTGFDSFDVKWINTSAGNYQTLKLDQAPDSVWKYFCFGNGTQCGQSEPPYYDELTELCYLPSNCPLPVFTLWTVINTCPICTQLICKLCSVTDRSNCLDCHPNSTLVSGSCICDTNYLPSYTAIDTSTLGLWNNVASSLALCLLNCTALIAGCKQNDCSSTTFCTACQIGFVLNPISGTVQSCHDCPSLIIHCIQCTSLTMCILCDSGFYPLSTGLCDLCSNPMPNCITCTNYQTCTLCATGYYFNSISHQCLCDPVYYNLANCQACSSPTVCTACVSNFYYLSPTDSLCYLCKIFDPQCVQCKDFNQCTSCNSGFTVVSVSSGLDACYPCSTLIPHCSTCSSPTVCTDCNLYYGLTSGATCQICDALVMPGCQTCQVASTCLTCNSVSVFISGVCHFCNEIYLCLTCFANQLNQLQCSSCVDGYFLKVNSLNGNKQCKPCMNLMSFCATCTVTQCLSCLSPYILSADGTCSGCQPGYEFYGGFCMKLAGCMTSIIQPDGTQICIACISQLHFIFDDRLKKCVCAEGYKQFNQIGFLMKCIPLCGNGIISPGFEECDDNNLDNYDGCDEFCKVEADFHCSKEPSQCVLSLDINLFIYSHAFRVVGENKGILSFMIEPRHYGLQKLQWNKLLSYNFSSTAVSKFKLTYSYSLTTGQLQVTVPYNQQLQDTGLETILTLDPKYIISRQTTFKLENKLNGVNAKLIFQEEALLSAHRNVSVITWIITLLLLLQFYVGSYFHKMIGLETIQVIQSIYFVRMLVNSSSTSILSSMNVIEYSAGGYENAELFYGDLTQVQNFSSGSTASAFTAINLKRFFLLNVNLSLAPVCIVIIIYMLSICRKFYARNQYIQTKQQAIKDEYTILRRSCQWVYDHGVFPFILMFNLISFFEVILELSSKNTVDSSAFKAIQSHSFPVQIFMLVSTVGIYCYQVFQSYEDLTKYNMTSKQRQRIPKSTVETLQHDQNNLDRANYHPGYVLVYLIYYFLLAFIMLLSVLIPVFKYYLELTIGLGIVYFLIIIIWKPYHSAINVHNHFLKIYYGTFVLFLAICYLFSKVQKLSATVYVVLIYLIMVLVSIIMMGGFVRIYIEKKFRAALQLDSDLMKWEKNTQGQENLQKSEAKNLLKSKQALRLNNKFLFSNQLDEIAKKYGSRKLLQQGEKLQNNDIKIISPQKQKYLIKRMRHHYAKKRQNLILDQVTDCFMNNFQVQTQQKLKNSLNNKLQPDNDQIFNQQKKFVNESIKKPKLTFSDDKDNETLANIKSRLKKEWILMEA